uniref:VWFD domain-containing protein n=1 Tax=Ciona savignyi TaxID=51511 RepID=H2YYT0_CIOSA
GSCCRTCEMCELDGHTYSSTTTFPHPTEPCRICQCQQGVVRCIKLGCERSCSHPREEGACCPDCSGCRYQDTLYEDGQFFNPPDNPCRRCSCYEGNVLCRDTRCPVPDCAKPETPSGECCPKCTEAIHKCCGSCENCFYLNQTWSNGHRFQPNACQDCVCINGNIQCVTKACRPLSCPLNQQGTCCPICDRCYLDVENRNVASGFSWRVSECQSCRCDLGSIVCSTQQCPMLDCPHGMLTYKQPVTPGECCPHCIPRPASCVAFGDPHYQTFDGRMIHFQGTCRYLLTADCSRAAFRVEVENRNIGGDARVSWTDRVHMTVAHHRITVDGFYNVMLNGTQVPHLPLLIKPYIFIDKSANTLLINTHLGVRLSWNALQHHLQVEVPSSFKKKLCGLCGNFNNLPQDDLRLRNSRIARSDIQFGNNWKVLGREMQSCPDATPYNPCDGISYRKRKRANNACKVINSDLFAQCHQVVSPAMYFSACVHDVCACGGNEDYCLCDVLETYAAQCRRAGVVVRWRSSTLCALNCPSELGYVFDECGSPCKRTCANTNLPPSVIEEQCYMPCVSGCQCPAGMVEYDGRCINSMDCPDT